MSLVSNVKESPEFASLCSYIQLFGEDLNVSLSHAQLVNSLEINNFESAPKQWIDLHRKLLNKIKVKCANDKWEVSMKKFVNTTLSAEITLPDLYDKDYFTISAQLRARLLNIIFDCQFDKNIKFKEKVNQKQDKDLRVQPFGSDIYGCLYWLFVDPEIDIILYKENLEEESFKVIAESVDEMRTLLNDLKTIDCENVLLSKLYIESITPEDTNSPNNELDIVKCEDDKSDIKEISDAILKVEECKEISQPERNGNTSPIKLENLITNDESLQLAQMETETSAHKDSENDDKLLVVTTEPKESILGIEPEDMDGGELFTEEKSADLKMSDKKKRGRPKADKLVPVEISPPDLNLSLRRSERKRKPVNPFSIAYISPLTKKFKIIDSQNDNTDLVESECIKKGKAGSKEHSQLGIPNKLKKHSKKESKDEKKLKKHSNKKSKDQKKSKKKSKHKVKFQGKDKNKKPWEGASSSEEHPEEEEEEYIYQCDESEVSANAGIEDGRNDMPESDFDPENLSLSSDEETLKSRGRNYFRQKSRLIKPEQEDSIDDKPCQICLGGNLPEMILLCDDCDFGHHAMCLKPSLMLIPEGDWFCPKCQHQKLVNKLSDKIAELDKSLAKNSAKIRMQERLNFVNISMSNILSSNRSKKSQKRSSNDESERRSPNDSSSPSYTSSSKTGDSSDGSSSEESDKGNHGRYKFRESNRKDNTRYNFEEIDKIFDSALENDEKYQIMKNRQVHDESNESEPEYDYSGIEPRKKSSGKDMSNILEEEKPKLRRPTKRKRLAYASDDDDFEDDAKDQDFKLSDQSCSDGYDEDDKLTADDASDSDEAWGIRPRRSARKSHKRKDKKKKRRVEYQDVASRPKRTAARKVNYLEMLGEAEDGEEGEKSPDYASSDLNDSSKPPPVLARNKSKKTNRRRKLSESEYEESNYNSVSDSNNDSGSTEKLQSVRKKNIKCLDSDTDSQIDDDENRSPIDEVSANRKDGNTNVLEGDTDDKEEDTNAKEDNSNVKEDNSNVKEDNSNSMEDNSYAKEDNSNAKEDNFNAKEDNMNVKEDRTNVKDDGINAKKGGCSVEDSTKVGEEDASTKEEATAVGSRSSLSIMNPMRAKANQDIDVENEVESESESDTESPLKICVNPVTGPDSEAPRSFSRY